MEVCRVTGGGYLGDYFSYINVIIEATIINKNFQVEYKLCVLFILENTPQFKTILYGISKLFSTFII